MTTAPPKSMVMSRAVPTRNSVLSSRLVAAKAGDIGDIEALLAPGEWVDRAVPTLAIRGHYNSSARRVKRIAEKRKGIPEFSK